MKNGLPHRVSSSPTPSDDGSCNSCSGRRTSDAHPRTSDSSVDVLDRDEIGLVSQSAKDRKRKRSSDSRSYDHKTMSDFSAEIQKGAMSLRQHHLHQHRRGRDDSSITIPTLAPAPLKKQKKPHHRRWRGDDASFLWNSQRHNSTATFGVQNLTPPPTPPISSFSIPKKHVHWDHHVTSGDQPGDQRDDEGYEDDMDSISFGPPPPPPPLEESANAHWDKTTGPTSYREGTASSMKHHATTNNQQSASSNAIIVSEIVDRHHKIITTTNMQPRDPPPPSSTLHPSSTLSRVLPKTAPTATVDQGRTSENSSRKGELAESQFQLQEMLGQGHFGKIFRATMPQNTSSKSLAMKRFSKGSLIKASRRGGRIVELIKREIGIHRRIEHQHIVKFFGHIFGKTHLSLVLEFAPHGDLFGFMGRVPSSLERLTVARQVLRQMATAVDYLGRVRSIAHRDIKPENILVFGEKNDSGKLSAPVFKLCDFGWAVRFSQNHRQTTLCGTPEYVPFEMLQTNTASGKLSYDAQYCDLWALGVLMYELLHGCTPFFVDDEPNGQKLDKVTHTRLVYKEIRRFQGAQYLPMDCMTVDCFHLMDSLLQRDPKRRCSAHTVANHTFLSQFYMS